MGYFLKNQVLIGSRHMTGYGRQHPEIEGIENFSTRFAARKRDDGVLDFHDLEQHALQLLWDRETGQPTEIARHWRHQFRFIFVDEYQDINAAQDKIIQAISRDGGEANRFLVGDVKQSIYRFRLAEPAIFRDYAERWGKGPGMVLPLTDNFRSREGILDFVNSLFGLLMHREVGGIAYDESARLRFGVRGEPPASDAAPPASPSVELLLRLNGQTRSDQLSAESSESQHRRDGEGDGHIRRKNDPMRTSEQGAVVVAVAPRVHSDADDRMVFRH